MEMAMASAIGILTAAGVYLLLRARSFDVILGLTLLSYATNLLIFAGGRLVAGKPPVLRDGVDTSLAHYTDPLPQALVLTAIVIAFAMTAVSIVIAIRSRADNDSDHVDGSRAEREFRHGEQRRHALAREAALAAERREDAP
ncbi:Na+/H+ antiporter subunit C [Pseudoxanthomonas sp. 10H]|uniref:Na+/H+ antiporter subunit C n=1 Tax=Pseudoxanthomonas sp. 10H TaxID=3242729 RepID=UPI0035563610